MHSVDVGEVRLEVREEGAGPPVVLLHGFPESSYSWRHVMTALAGAGFRAIAPDQRGYVRSDKPRGIAAYRIERLVADVIGLLDALGLPRATIVGHDWGAVVAWSVAALHPDRVERLVVMNGPHPQLMRRLLITDPAQLWRSKYILFFQLPWLPEYVATRADFAARAFLGLASRGEAFDDETLAHHRDGHREPGCATGMLGWYRAGFWYGMPKLPKVTCPVLCIWGDDDRALGVRFTENLERYATNVRVEHLAGVGHWVQQEAPGEVSALLIDALRR
ncbi:MAG: alpha/beta hydrolase [Polyangia bacterium]